MRIFYFHFICFDTVSNMITVSDIKNQQKQFRTAYHQKSRIPKFCRLTRFIIDQSVVRLCLNVSRFIQLNILSARRFLFYTTRKLFFTLAESAVDAFQLSFNSKQRCGFISIQNLVPTFLLFLFYSKNDYF